MAQNGLIPQDQYDLFLDLMPIVCVDVAVIHRTKVLLVKRANEPMQGQWWLPGGRLHKNESLEACALRKSKEEVGLECILGPLVHTQSTIFEKVHSVNFCYVLYALDDNVKADDTILNWRWGWNDKRLKLHSYVERCLDRAMSAILSEALG